MEIGGRLPTATQLHQSFIKILSKHLAANKKLNFMFQQQSSTIPMMNPSPTEIVELFVFVEVTLIQYATVAGHFPGVNASSVKPKPKKANKVEVTSDEPKGETQINATTPTTPRPKPKAQPKASDDFTASKTPSYPSLRMAQSVASHMGWPIECWDVSTAFLYARLFGDRDTDLGGNEIFMKPPRILVETEVVDDGVVWKIKKALYGLRTSPIAWETERDNTLKSLTWRYDETEYRLLPCQGSP